MPRLKIAQVATSDMAIRVLLLDHIRALEQMGHEVVAVCAPGPRVEELRQQGIAVETVPFAREFSPAADLRALRRLIGLFRRHAFDVVHTHTPKAGLLGPLAARWARVPVVVHTVHGLLFHDRMPRWKQRAFWLPEKFTAACAHYLLSQSRADMEVAVARHICDAGRLTYLGNGIDVRHFCPQPGGALRREARAALGFGEGEVVVGAVGRLVYEKGFGELFSAAEEMARRHPQVRFLIVGPQESDQKDAVADERVRALAASGAMRFVGWQEEMVRWYSAMDAFVLPSHREGVPRAAMEAAAMELPVVATDIRGCREVVRHGETGLLVAARDAAALAGALESLLADSGLRRAMGQAGRRHIERDFNQEQVLDRLRAFYAGLEERVAREKEKSR